MHLTGPVWVSWPISGLFLRNNIRIVKQSKIENRIENKIGIKIKHVTANRLTKRIANKADIFLFLYDYEICISMHVSRSFLIYGTQF